MSKFVSPNGQFECVIESRQCEAITLKGDRCKRMTRQQLPYCYDHTKRLLELELRPSSIPGAGKGLFALKEFDKDELIVSYGGELIDEEELERRYDDDTAAYAVQVVPNVYLDGACVRGTGSMANTNPRHNNAEMRTESDSEVALYAIKKIEIGDEIFVSYGRFTRDYIHGNLSHSKKTSKKKHSKKSSKKKTSKKSSKKTSK